MPQDPSKRLVTEADFFDPASPAGARIREAVADDLADPTSPASALLNATFVSYAAPPKGVASTDTAALQAAINALPIGGTFVLASGVYALNASLTVTKHITIRGMGVTSNYGSRQFTGETAWPGISPHLIGTVLRMTVPATDAIKLTGSGQSANLDRFGVVFADGLASTGDGISARTTTLSGAGPAHDQGLVDFLWSNVSVYGHDGNHYAFNILNPQYGTLLNPRSYGGGGILIEADAGQINAGNMLVLHPFVNVRNAGTAHGVAHKAAITAGEPGMVNFVIYHRPQVVMSGPAAASGTPQRPWHDLLGAGIPQNVQIYNPDFEGLSAGSKVAVFGSGTEVSGNGIIDFGERILGVGVGAQAGGMLPGTAGHFVAIGYRAGGSETADGQFVAVGRDAGRLATNATKWTAIGEGAAERINGNSSVAIGYGALRGAADGAATPFNVAIGEEALGNVVTSSGNNVGIGRTAGGGVSTGEGNVFLGGSAGFFTSGSTGNRITTGNGNTYIGREAGSSAGGTISNSVAIGVTATVGDNDSAAIGNSAKAQKLGAVAIGYNANANGVTAIAIGYAVSATADGAVAIGRDNAGNSASATTANAFILGTVNHRYKMPGLPTTNPGAGTGVLWNDAGTVKVA